MKRRRTVDDLNRLWSEGIRSEWVTTWRTPEDAGDLLFTTSSQGCLTHITRFVGDKTAHAKHARTFPANRYYEALCGVGSSRNRGAVVVDPSDEMFGCHLCIAKAERYGLPSYGLLPSTGCEATAGARFRPRRPK